MSKSPRKELAFRDVLEAYAHRRGVSPAEALQQAEEKPRWLTLAAPSDRLSSPRPSASTPRQPERTFGPYANGIGVAVWLNTIETPDGLRPVRSVTLSPRRYFDRTAEEWRDASSYRPTDVPALIFALQKAQEYLFTAPLPGGKGDDERDAHEY